MTTQAVQDPAFGFVPGDHVCAFYNSSQRELDDIVVDYVTRGLQAGSKVYCLIDRPAKVRNRLAPQLTAADDRLTVLTGDEAYLPGGRFSKDAFIRSAKAGIADAAERGYGSFRVVGDESFIVRNRVDAKEWFAAESELNAIAGDFPHFFFCLYDLDLFDASTVMRVLSTHPRVYVNGIIIGNPHYQAAPLPV